MGIYDRPYYRRPTGRFGGGLPGMPPGGRGIPHPRTWSVTIWLIVINVAVAMLGAIPPLNSGVTLKVSRQTTRTDVTPADVRSATPFVPAGAMPGNFVTFDVPLIRPAEDPAVVPPDYLVRIDGDPKLYERVGTERRFWSGDTQSTGGLGVLGGYGHFSTMQGFRLLGVWRLITFQFLHGGFFHLLFNMFGLWIFGGITEQYLGKRRFLAYYLICGIAGALLYLILNGAGALNIPLPGALDVSVNTPLVGASAGVFGVIMACAKISPNATVQLLLLPIPIRMKWFAYGYVVMAALNLIVFKGNNAGGDAAHVGGAVAGYYFIRNAHLLNDFFDVFGRRSSSSKPAKPRVTKPPKRARRGQPSADDVDRVLAKVSTGGLHSLTEKEKAILRKASESGG
ncbi:MAG: rhomboid family intramembrane serine protease [Planctomycetota bacterium]